MNSAHKTNTMKMHTMKMHRLYKTRPVDGFANCETVRPIRREMIGGVEWFVVIIVATGRRVMMHPDNLVEGGAQ